MAKHILTFILVFFGLMMVMRACAPKPELEPAVPEFAALRPAEGETYVLEDRARGLRVELDRAGRIVSILAGKESALRCVPPWSRPFALQFLSGEGRQTLPEKAWTSEELPGGAGRVFRASSDGLQVTKTVRLAPGGEGVDLELKVEGGGTGMSRIWLTGVSGVPLPESDEETRSGLFWQIEGGRPQLFARDSLEQLRETERTARLRRLKAGKKNVPARLPYALRRELQAGVRVERYGILGARFYVALEEPGAVSELKADVFRTRRGGAVSPEIEAWMELVAPGGTYAGGFHLRVRPRGAQSVRKLFDSLFVTARTLQLENEDYRVELTERGASIRAAWLKRFTVDAGQEPGPDTWVPILRRWVRAGERSLILHGDPDRYGEDPGFRVWSGSPGADGRSVTFTLETRKGWRFKKTITLPEPGRYDFGVVLEIEAPASESGRPAAEEAKLVLTGPAGCYIADAYRGIIGASPPAGLILERAGGDSEDETIENLAEGEELRHTYGANRRGLLKAVALRGAYFTCALVTEDPGAPDRGFVTQAVVRGIELEREVPRADGKPSRENMAGRIACVVPLENGRARLAFRFYAGPTNVDDLRPLDIDDAVDYGTFEIIGRGLMWLMKFFHGLVGSWGLAILLMTVVIRSLLLPVSYKTQLSMQRYQKRLTKIKPILEELEKRYGKNSQKLNQERMRVMREHKVGLPLGCLMMFVQIPIWWALFQALRVEFALRHQSFLWAQDLSMPDQLFRLPFWPHQFNFFPILMLVLWVIQQKVAPQAGADDPQVKAQMRMMKFMPYVFFFMLYKYAAALAIYMCISSAWSIAEGKLVRRAVARAAAD